MASPINLRANTRRNCSKPSATAARQSRRGDSCRPAAGFVSLCLLLGVCNQAVAAVALLTVGGDASCDYRTDLQPNALQSAISAVPLTVPVGDLYVIHVARSGNYDGVQLVVNDRGMLIEGGYETCDDFSRDTSNTVIDSMAMNLGAVMRIDGMSSRESVTLSHLRLSGGTGTAGSGLYVRNADVRLDHVTLSENHGAIRGGGLHVEGIDHGASVEIHGGSGIVNNSVAQNGGGISCDFGAQLTIHSDTGISGNTAGIYGGGVHIGGCSGSLNSGGIGFGSLLYNVANNTAHYGAGIALLSDTGATDFVIGEGMNASTPRPLIVSNNASNQGGGIFASGADTELTINNSVVAQNTAVSLGGGVMVLGGARVRIGRSLPTCVGFSDCSQIFGNEASIGGGAGVAGNDSRLLVSGTLVSDNTATQGGSALLSLREYASLIVSDSFLVGNNGPSVIEVSPGSAIPPREATAYLAASTIAGNSGLTSVVNINDEGSATFNRMLVNAGAAVPSISKTPGNADPTYLCSIFHESTSIDGQDIHTSFSTSPGFIDPGSGNYHLHALAWAIDQCPADDFLVPLDYDLDSRPVDSPLGNLGGPFDVGADEWTGILFRDGFEG